MPDKCPCESCYFKDVGPMVDPCFWCCQDNCFGTPKSKWNEYIPDTMAEEEVKEHFRKEREQMSKLFGDEIVEALKEIRNEQKEEG